MMYYIFDGKENIGPLEVEQLVERPGFDANTLVCPVGATSQDDWRPAGTLLVFTRAFKLKPVPAAPPAPAPASAPATATVEPPPPFQVSVTPVAAPKETQVQWTLDTSPAKLEPPTDTPAPAPAAKPAPTPADAPAPSKQAEAGSPICAKCSHRNPDGSSFCNACGTKLSATMMPEAIVKSIIAKMGLKEESAHPAKSDAAATASEAPIPAQRSAPEAPPPPPQPALEAPPPAPQPAAQAPTPSPQPAAETASPLPPVEIIGRGESSGGKGKWLLLAILLAVAGMVAMAVYMPKSASRVVAEPQSQEAVGLPKVETEAQAVKPPPAKADTQTGKRPRRKKLKPAVPAAR